MNRTGVILLILIISGAGYFASEQAKTAGQEDQSQRQGNALEMFDTIRVSAPQPNDVVQSPLLVEGRAQGSWYFEGDFSVRILDSNGKELGSSTAQSLGDWKTQSFVPFQVTILFTRSSTAKGMLILERTNPVLLPEQAEALRIPIRFRE